MDGRIWGLGLILRLAAKIAATIATVIGGTDAIKLKPSERAALLAAAAALNALLAERPIPGDDNSPGTVE